MKRTGLVAKVGGAVAVFMAFVVGTAGAAAECEVEAHLGRPTFIGGTIVGYPDNRYVNALIGIDAKDAQGRKVDRNGVPCDAGGECCAGGYSRCQNVNRALPPEGVDADSDSAPDTPLNTWGGCWSSKITEVFLEVYPRNPLGETDKARYGSALHHHMPISPTATNKAGLRLPLTFEAGGGNTGTVNGYLTYNGVAVPLRDAEGRSNLVFRAWPIPFPGAPETTPGSSCGIQGFSAGSDHLGNDNGKTFYRIIGLAGGQCGAATQRYRVKYVCKYTCGSSTVARTAEFEIGRGDLIPYSPEFGS